MQALFGAGLRCRGSNRDSEVAGHSASTADRSRRPEIASHPFAALRERAARAHVAVGGGALEDRLLYRVTEVTVFLNLSRSKVYELLASGELPSVKIDHTRLVRRSDFRDYVESLRPVA
jgi:excisionase family DNA binding protein